MIRPGICSVTLAEQTPREVLQTAIEAGLQGIEWWGKDHVPHGEIDTARRVGEQTRAAGLEVPSYGSYYRAGVSEDEGLSFASVLETAHALGAPMIRIWAGNQNGIDASAAHVQAVIDDTRRIADLAAARDTSVVFEYHGGSLTDRNDTAVRFAAQVEHPNVYFSWQPPHGYTLEHCLEGLQALLPRLGTLHVYHWTIGSYENNTVNETIRPLIFPDDFHRHPLADGKARWQAYFDAARSTGRDHWALLEFVKDNSREQVVRDAAVLTQLTTTHGPQTEP
jgi:3-dehydroshikimate dehydratase